MARNGVDFGIRVSGTGDALVHGAGRRPGRPVLPGLRPGRREPRPRRQRDHRDVRASAASRWRRPRPSCGSSGGTPADAIALHPRRWSGSPWPGTPAYALPPLGFGGTPTGIDARRVVETGIAPVINTGIAHREAGVGQIGAGIARAPLACFDARGPGARPPSSGVEVQRRDGMTGQRAWSRSAATP